MLLVAVGASAAGLWVTRTPGAVRPDPAGTALAAAARQAPPAFDSARAWEHLKQIVAIGPRPSGSPALRQTRAYITRQIAALGLTVLEQPFTAQTPKGPIEMVNLIVRLPGRRPDRLLVTGHYDTKLFTDQRFVGASDGGSSTAVLLELARTLKDRPRDLTFELVFFDGEEAVVEWGPWEGPDHAYGSRRYVAEARRAGALGQVKAMVLVDMVGDRDLGIRRESRSTRWLTDIIWDTAKRLGHGGYFLDAETEIQDDHWAFLDANVPAVDIIDLDYPQWHTPQDDLQAVSARSLQIVGEVVLAALPDIDRRLAR
jgi:Zn-dependent M28 family amino/carboxypeptidase